MHAEKHGAAGGAERVAALGVHAVGALQAAQEVVHAAQHVLRDRQQLEVVPAELRAPVGPLERLLGVLPREAGERLAPALELPRGLHHAHPRRLDAPKPRRAAHRGREARG